MAADHNNETKLRVAFDALDTFSHHMLLNAFQRMNVFLQPGESYNIYGLFSRLKINPRYARLFGLLLNMLRKVPRRFHGPRIPFLQRQAFSVSCNLRLSQEINFVRNVKSSKSKLRNLLKMKMFLCLMILMILEIQGQ